MQVHEFSKSDVIRLFDMARLAIVLVATFIFTAQCAVIRNEESLKRIARSPCDSCNRDGPPGPPPPPPPPPPPFFPPPPPPDFHTQQWSGYARSADGRQQGVFSGAAAQALDGTHSGGEAYSLAASEANANTGQESYNAQHLKDSGNDVQQIQGSGFGSPSQGQAKNSYSSSVQGSSFQRSDLQNQQQSQHEFGAASASSHAQSSSGGGYGSNGKYQSNHGGEFGSQSLNDVQQVQDNGFGATSQAKAKSSYGTSQGSDFGRGDLGSEQQIPSGGLENQQQVQSGFGTSAASQAQSSTGNGYVSGGKYKGNNGAENLQQQQQFGSQGLSANQGQYRGHTQYGQQQGSYGYGSGPGSSGQQNAHKALKGALDLAHQGLQTPQAGCSTCGKSSYALSNAKSHSGNAIALSVSG